MPGAAANNPSEQVGKGGSGFSLSLKNRITLMTLSLFLIGIWSLTIYAARSLRQDVGQLLGDQQLAATSIVAEQLNDELQLRLQSLELLAGKITPELLGSREKLQRFIEERNLSQLLFNGGVRISGPDGNTLASAPYSPERIGANYADRDYMIAALQEGKTAIGKPVSGKVLKEPVIGMAAPVRDRSGRVIGAIVGAVNLGKANFMDQVTRNVSKEGGGYLVIAPQHGIIVTGTDKTRLMSPAPSPGVNPMYDRYVAGYEGFGIAVSSRGVEEISAARRVPAAGWLLVNVLPTEKAFAPLQVIQQRMLFAALIFSVLLGALVWWLSSRILRRQFAPIVSASRLLTDMSSLENQPLRQLPVDKNDEVGELFQSFNRLLGSIEQGESSLRQSLQRLHNMSDAAGAYLWEVDNNMVYTYVSGQSAHVKGYPPESLIGHTPMEFMPEEDIVPVGEIVTRAIAAKTSFRLQHRNITPLGDLLWEEVYGAVFLDEMGEVIGLRGTGMSINARKQAERERDILEQQMLNAQKLESLGVLAGGIAHDFNNILMAIIGNAELALMRLKPESPAIGNLKNIETAAGRAADLAKQMLAYSGKGKFVVEHINLNILLEEMMHMLQVSISKKAVLRFNPYNPLPAIEVDATQIRQIVMNLIINASEAIGDKSGVIAISTGCMYCDRSYLKDVWLDENITAGLYVYLEIADTGCGMDRETVAKLFDPFFTTKFTGRGLGMAAVLGIVRGHKGAIKVYSEKRKGTTFKILIPAAAKQAELFNVDAAVDNWKGQGTILLVDDEDSVRAIGGEMLKELGFTVVTASDGRDAVAIYRKNQADITLVLLDLTMPHMDGVDCFRELRRINPDIKVIISSGFSEQEITQRFAGKGLAGFIQKPYRMTALRELIKGV